MEYIFGFAGIARENYDQIYRKRSEIVGEKSKFLGETLKDSYGDYYIKGHFNFFLNEFHKLLSNDDHNSLSDTIFSIIYLENDGLSASFSDLFFPAILTVPVVWQPSGFNRTTKGHSENQLVNLLKEAVNSVKRGAKVLHRELREQDQRTPWLLPIGNFDSAHLRPRLKKMAADLVSDTDPQTAVKDHTAEFRRKHPPQTNSVSSRSFFVDDRSIAYNPPGKARHAFARSKYEEHPKLCLLNGRRRLGFPYDRAFHYDCTKGKSNLVGNFTTCHHEIEKYVGSPHLNIAPNDFVRK